jgi:hypothetical protein
MPTKQNNLYINDTKSIFVNNIIPPQINLDRFRFVYSPIDPSANIVYPVPLESVIPPELKPIQVEPRTTPYDYKYTGVYGTKP